MEIRSAALPDTLPIGMLRLPMPTNPPLRAASVEVAIVDTDRQVVSTGGNVTPSPQASTSGTYADSLYGTL